MAVAPVQFEQVFTAGLVGKSRDELQSLLYDAYGEDLTSYLRDIGPGVHVLGRVGGVLVTHAMIVDRMLQTGNGLRLHAAYVELVATAPRMQGRGYASALMTQLVRQMDEHDIGALSPVNAGFYAQFDWEAWRGPLSVRTPDGTVASPEERVMILRLPRTPEPVDLDAALSVEWRPGEVW